MGIKLQGLRADLNKETDGVWVPCSIGGEIKVCRANNPNWKKRERELRRPWRQTIRQGRDIPESAAEEITSKLLAYEGIKDWKGLPFTDDDGKDIEVPFSAKAAFEIFCDEEMKDFREEVAAACLNREFFSRDDEPSEEDEMD